MVYENPMILVNSPDKNTINDENNPNTSNVSEQTANILSNKCDQEEDALFNISDSVLKDVTL